MGTRGFWELGEVSDDQLRQDLAKLLAHGYRTEARIVAHLAELDERKLHVKDASESLFSYCTERLGLSNSEAFHRITVARVGNCTATRRGDQSGAPRSAYLHEQCQSAGL